MGIWHFRIEVSTLGFQPKKEGAVPSSATNKLIRDCSFNWLERQLVTLEVVGSNLIGPATNKLIMARRISIPFGLISRTP